MPRPRTATTKIRRWPMREFQGYCYRAYGTQYEVSSNVVKALAAFIQEELAAGRDLRLQNLGRFYAKQYKNNLGDCLEVRFDINRNIKKHIKQTLRKL